MDEIENKIMSIFFSLFVHCFELFTNALLLIKRKVQYRPIKSHEKGKLFKKQNEFTHIFGILAHYSCKQFQLIAMRDEKKQKFGVD